MRKLIITIAMLALLVAGCEKEETKPDCELKGYGYIKITNTSSNPYDFIVDGKTVKRIAGNTSITNIQINKGVRTVEALQVSGYLFSPTQVVKNITVTSCDDHNFVFP